MAWLPGGRGCAGLCVFSRVRQHVLLVQSYSRGRPGPARWSLPKGGSTASDESAWLNAVRECREETHIDPDQLFRWHLEPYVIDARRGPVLLFAASHDGRVDEVRHRGSDPDTQASQWFLIESLADLPMQPAHRDVIRHFLAADFREACPWTDERRQHLREMARSEGGGRHHLEPLGPQKLRPSTRQGSPRRRGRSSQRLRSPASKRLKLTSRPSGRSSSQRKVLEAGSERRRGRGAAPGPPAGLETREERHPPNKTWTFQGVLVAQSDCQGRPLCGLWNSPLGCKAEPACRRRHVCNALIAGVACVGAHRGIDHARSDYQAKEL
jgi:8-oxo-dGTP pyrophosphatase MutT (NUDIX family)